MPGSCAGWPRRSIAYAAGGGTNMYACLSAPRRRCAAVGPTASGLIIVMSDGQSEARRARRAMPALKALGVPVIAIAFGDGADPAQLREVADATGGAFFQQADLVAALRQAAGYK